MEYQKFPFFLITSMAYLQGDRHYDMTIQMHEGPKSSYRISTGLHAEDLVKLKPKYKCQGFICQTKCSRQ